MRTKYTLNQEKIEAIISLAKEIGANPVEVRQASKDLHHRNVNDRKASTNKATKTPRIGKNRIQIREWLTKFGLNQELEKKILFANVSEKTNLKDDGSVSSIRFYAKAVYVNKSGLSETRKVPFDSAPAAEQYLMEVLQSI